MTHRRIMITAGSTRRDSAHALLARHVAGRLDELDRSHVLVDLAEYDMPLYHGDLEAEVGVPESAHRLAELIAESGALLIATPEYNGAVTPLLKNTVDWVTRVDIGVLRDTYIGMMAASPGRLGGTRGLAMVRTWFDAMRLVVHDSDLSLPQVGEHIEDIDGSPRFDATTTDVIDRFLSGFLTQFDEYCCGRPAG